MKFESVALMQFKDLAVYIPTISDFVVWSGWFTTWTGVVSGYDQKTDEVLIIFSGMPYGLSVMFEDEYNKNTKKIPLADIKKAWKGSWHFQHHDTKLNAVYWYV